MRTRQTAKLEAAAAAAVSKEDEVDLSGEEDAKTLTLPEVLTLSPATPKDCEEGSVLCSALDPGAESDLYFNCDSQIEVEDSVLPPRFQTSIMGAPNQAIKDCVITPDFEQRETAPPTRISRHARKKLAKVLHNFYAEKSILDSLGGLEY